MNRRNLTCTAALFVSLITFSCSDIANLTTPKSVSVKSSGARYEVPLGTVEFNVSDKLSVSALQEKIGDTADIYDYNAGGNDTVQEYIIDYPLSSIPLDFSSYLSNLDLLDQTANPTKWEKSEAKPDVSFSKTISPDIANKINSAFDSGSPQTIRIYEPGSGNTLSTSDTTKYGSNGLSLDMTISEPLFSTMSYYTGGINIIVQQSSTPSSDFAFTVRAILKVDGKEVSSSGAAQNLTNGGTLIIPLDGVTLKPNFSIVFDGTTQNGTLLQEDTYSVSAAISDASKLKEVTGLTLTDSQLGSNSSVSISQDVDTSALNGYLISSVINEGSVSYNGVLPDGWSGVTCTSTVGISGGMTVASSDFTDVNDTSKNYLINKTANLNNVALTPATTTIGGDIKLAVNNATVVFPKDGSAVTISINGTCSIASLGTTVIDESKMIDSSTLTTDVSKELPDTVKTYLKSIVFHTEDENTPSLGLTGTIDSNFDVADMTMKIAVASTMFNMTAASNYDTLNFATLSADNSFSIKQTNDVTVTPSLNSTADIKATVSLFGTNNSSHPEYVTLNSFVFGKTYYITPTYDVSYNWSTVTLDTSGINLSNTLKTGFNIKSILNSYLSDSNNTLLDNVEFNDIKSYLYVKEPAFTSTSAVTTNPLSGIAMSGKVQAVTYTEDSSGNIATTAAITDSSGNDISYLIGSSSSTAELTLINDDSSIDFATISKNSTDGIITTAKTTLFNTSSYSSEINNITNIINVKPETLGLKYDMTFGKNGANELTLTKAQVNTLTSSSGTASINMSVAIVFPLSLDITDEIKDVNILKLSGNEITDDLLNRDSADDSSKWKDYAELVSYIECDYRIINSTGLVCSGVFSDTASGLSKTITCNNAEHALKLSRTEVDNIFDNYPFTPTMLMTFEKGNVSIPRDAEFGVTATMAAETDGEYAIWGDKE